MRTKTLTFKSPDKMKVFLLIFVVAFIFSSQVRDVTTKALHTTANLIADIDE